MRWAMKLRHRLLAMILLVLLPAAAIIAYDVYEARSRQIEAAQEQGQQLAQTILNSQERVVSSVEGLLDLLIRVPQVRGLTAPACSEIMIDIVRAQPRYATIAAAGADGIIRCASRAGGIGADVKERPWFQRAMATKSFTVGDYQIGKLSNLPILGFALPVLANDSSVLAVTYASIDLAWFGSHDAAQSLPENATFTLIDQTGMVMARYPDGADWNTKSIADTPLFKTLQTIDKQGNVKLKDVDGEDSYFHLVKLQRTPETQPIYVAVGLSLDQSMAAINQNMVFKIILLLTIAGLLTLFTYVTSARMISRPVQDMVDLSARIAGGDLSVRSGLNHDAGEFGTLARSLDSMAESLQENQQALLEQQQYMRAVLDNTSELILGFDNDGRMAFINATGKAAGIPEGRATFDDLIKLYDGIYSADMKPLAYGDIPVVRVMRGERINNVEVMARMRKGDPLRTMLVNGQPIYDTAGKRRGVVIAVRDITDLRATEASLRQSQKMEAVGQLTGGVAHDFNNLLSVVIGNIDTLLPHLKDKGDAELATEALNGALRGAQLTKQMLAFARRQALDPKPMRLSEHLPQLATMLRRTLGETITVNTHCAPDLWPCLVDAGQFDSVLLNFAINARDAMPQGGTLTIEATNDQLDAQYAHNNAEVTPGDYVRIAVSDNGSGIAPDVLARVMEPFFTTKAPGQGTGLGLSMAFGFAKQSGGHLKIYSEPGHGTTVNLYLPRVGAAEAQKAVIVDTQPELPKGRESILLVDDNDAVRKTAARQLNDLGYKVIEAENAPAALDILARGDTIHLLFSDVVMPGGLSGFDLAAQASELYPDLRILLVTGFAEAAVRNGAAKGLDVQLMSKPYRRQELAERIRGMLDSGK